MMRMLICFFAPYFKIVPSFKNKSLIMSTSGKILTALATGVAVGVVIGLHLTTEKKATEHGSEPRDEPDLADLLRKQFEKGRKNWIVSVKLLLIL
jgi:hypothetical protein